MFVWSLTLPIKLIFHECFSKKKQNIDVLRCICLADLCCMFSWQAHRLEPFQLIFIICTHTNTLNKRVTFAISRCLLFRINSVNLEYSQFFINWHNLGLCHGCLDRYWWILIYINASGSCDFRWNFGCSSKHRERANLSGTWNHNNGHRCCFLLSFDFLLAAEIVSQHSASFF